MSTAVFFVMGRYRIPWVPGLLLLGAAGMVDLQRRFRLRHWRALLWRAALLMVPAAVLAWRPMTDPVPERWGHMLIGMALADALAGRLEPAIDALDDARAFGAGPAERVEQLLAAGPLHDALGALIASRPKADRQAGLGRDADLLLALDASVPQRPRRKPAPPRAGASNRPRRSPRQPGERGLVARANRRTRRPASCLSRPGQRRAEPDRRRVGVASPWPARQGSSILASERFRPFTRAAPARPRDREGAREHGCAVIDHPRKPSTVCGHSKSARIEELWPWKSVIRLPRAVTGVALDSG